MSLPTLSAWLLTYWLHSTALLAATALVTTWFVKNDAWRETLGTTSSRSRRRTGSQ